MSSKVRALTISFLVWTVFVWGIVRLRNILSDPDLSGSGMIVPLVLSASFWVPAALLLLGIVRSRRSTSTGEPSRMVDLGLVGLAAWTIAVWIYKAIDIAIFSDHPIGFVVVHTVLAVVSVGLAGFVVVFGRQRLGRTSANPIING